MQIRFPVLAIAASLLSACIVELPSNQLPPSLDDRQPVFIQGTTSRNPIIQSFTANPSNVTKGQPITFQVVASDPDGSPLQLNWAATDGTLSTNTGQVVSWIPPEKPGVYSVTVTVANGRGGFVTGTQNLTVQANGSAVIGGKPASPPVPVLSPAALPSVTPSLIASATPTPVVSPAPVSPLPSVAVPSPTPSLAASPGASYIQLDITSQEARFDNWKQDWTTSNAEVVYLNVKSASNTRYRAFFTELQPVYGHGIVRPAEFLPDGTGWSKVLRKTAHILYFVREAYWQDESSGGFGTVRLKDGVLAHTPLPFHATVMDKANVTVPTGAWTHAGEMNNRFFAFKYDGGDLHLGTFNLP